MTRFEYSVRKLDGRLVSHHEVKGSFFEWYLPALGQDEQMLVVVYFEDVEVGKMLLKR